MKIVELNHVSLHVADVEKSREFYGGVLGFEEKLRPNFNFPGAWYAFGDTQELHLIGGRKEAVRSSSGGAHYAVAVEDIEAVKAHLVEKGVEIKKSGTRPDGVPQVFVADPDGNYIEFTMLVASE